VLWKFVPSSTPRSEPRRIRRASTITDRHSGKIAAGCRSGATPSKRSVEAIPTRSAPNRRAASFNSALFIAVAASVFAIAIIRYGRTMYDMSKSSNVPPGASTGNAPRRVQSVDRALRLLAALAAAPGGRRLAELAEQTGLAKQTAQSLLRTLEAWQLCAQPERGAPYVLGPRALFWARQWLAGEGHARLAAPIVEAFAEEIGESALLAELRGGALYRLVEVESAQAVAARPKWLPPERIHRMATGRVLLAHLPETARARALNALDYSGGGARAPRSAAALARRLAAARAAGFAEMIGENDPHLAAAAVPVRTPDGAVHAALGVYLPLGRYPKRRRPALRAALRAAAARIEAAWRGPPATA